MAGLIPQAFIDDLLNRADIIDVIDNRVPLKKSGKNYSACCPFHNEKTPSFSVQPERQFYYCFGCGAAGNAIGFIMNFEQLDFPQAVEALAKENGLEVPREESAASQRKQSENAKLFEVLDKANDFFRQQLRHHENKQAAVEYLVARGVSGEIARDFNIGYAPPGWDNLLSAIGKDASVQSSLAKSGMVIEKDSDKKSGSGGRDYYDRFRHRIMFPIRDTRGRTIAFGGRVLGDDKPKYLNSPETPVFHKGSELYGLYEVKKSSHKFGQLLLVEGYMDVIALAQMGIKNAVATLGTATSSHHLNRLFKIVPEVVFCFDGDKAGRTAAWRALEATLPQMEDGRQVKFLFLPEGEDPDTLVRKIGQDKFNQELANATPLETFFFDKLAVGIDVATIEGKARLSNLAKPYLKQLPHGVYGQLMQDRLADLLGVSSASLSNLLDSPEEQEQQGQDLPPPPDIPDYVPSSATAPRENRNSRSNLSATSDLSTGLRNYRRPAAVKAIELLLRNPEIALSLDTDLSPLKSAEDESRKLLLTLIEIVQKDPTTRVFTLLGYCYGTSLGNQLTQLLKEEKITPTEGVEGEFKQIVDSIVSDIKRKLYQLQIRDKLMSKFGDRSMPHDQIPDSNNDGQD
ncbi:MAG: DNA primase [Pseudohongiellaceae bacterium]